MSHEMHAKEWHFNTSKTAEGVIFSDLISTLRVKSMNAHKGKVDMHVDNKYIWKRVNSLIKVANHFNQDSASEIIAIMK